METYIERLRASVHDTNSVLCVGLDPDPAKLPKEMRRPGESMASLVERFCVEVVRATSDIASSYKPNLAFFESLGRDGLQVFGSVCDAIPDDRIIIADAKRGDIGNTADHYAEAFLEIFACDAITVSPLMGIETLKGFTTRAEKAVYVLTLTSNPGASDFLEQPMAAYPSLGEYIAHRLADFDQERPSHVGMVLGATRADKLAPILNAHPNASLLLPGVGAQGGDVDTLIQALQAHQGIPVIPISRGILFGEEQGPDGIRSRAVAYHQLLYTLSQAYV
jgi:orotidine-5'-phosphate decarboxylase